MRDRGAAQHGSWVASSGRRRFQTSYLPKKGIPESVGTKHLYKGITSRLMAVGIWGAQLAKRYRRRIALRHPAP